MAEVEVQAGLSAEDIVEREAGGLVHRAVGLVELAGAAEFARREFEYDDEDPARELVRLSDELLAHLARVSVSGAGTLTLHRVCRRCDGRDSGDCMECGGRGSVHADEAEG